MNARKFDINSDKTADLPTFLTSFRPLQAMAARGWSVFILCLLVATLRMGFTWVESRYSFRSRPFRLRGAEKLPGIDVGRTKA